MTPTLIDDGSLPIAEAASLPPLPPGTEEVALVMRTDCHVAEHGPRSRKDNYREAVMDKLGQVGDLARALRAAAVLDNGDFFHLKSGPRNPHGLVREVAELHATRYGGIPVYENPGNHDFPYGNVAFLEGQPLAVLFATGVFRPMTDVTFTQGGLRVRVVGLPYRPDYDVEQFDLARGDEDVLVVAAHTYASPEGGQFFGREAALSYRDLATTSPDVFLFGHWHIDQGIAQVGGKLFYNLGSLTRGALVQDNLTRIPRVGSLRVWRDPLTGAVTLRAAAHALRVRPASEIFDLVERRLLESEERSLEGYLTSLRALIAKMRDPAVEGGAGPEVTTSAVRRLVQELDPELFSEEVRDRAAQYLELHGGGGQ
jgi:hypothetical protein